MIGAQFVRPKDRNRTRGALPADYVFFAEATDGRVQLVPGSYRRAEERFYSDHHALSTQVIPQQ